MPAFLDVFSQVEKDYRELKGDINFVDDLKLIILKSGFEILNIIMTKRVNVGALVLSKSASEYNYMLDEWMDNTIPLDDEEWRRLKEVTGKYGYEV